MELLFKYRLMLLFIMNLQSSDLSPSLPMFRLLVRRLGYLRRGWLRPMVVVFLAVLFVDMTLIISRHTPTVRVPPSMSAPRERIFVAGMHWNNEIILRSHWCAGVLDLVRHFGPENVFVSVIETGSWDGTKTALKDLDTELEKLGVERSIEMQNQTHEDEVERIPGPQEEGWIWTTRGKRELRRIPYLAGIRNQAMGKLKQLAERTEGHGKRYFDKVLWLNDVVFTTEDVITLIATRDGNYAAACSLDFSNPPLYYDSFALRDISGAEAVTQVWPYFSASASRNAIMSNSPAPVKSCWGGVAVFQADSFYKKSSLRFRGIPDGLAIHHLEGSECCLIHVDNELTAVQGVWLNPNVRVAYDAKAYKLVNPANLWWPSSAEQVKGVWNNRWARCSAFIWRYRDRYIVGERLRLWRDQIQGELLENHQEEGAHCLIDEMQVLTSNGWAHV